MPGLPTTCWTFRILFKSSEFNATENFRCSSPIPFEAKVWSTAANHRSTSVSQNVGKVMLGIGGGACWFGTDCNRGVVKF